MNKIPLSKRAEKLYSEAMDACSMLNNQGQSSAECRYKEVMAELLFLIFLRLDSFCAVVLVLLGSIGGYLLAKLF